MPSSAYQSINIIIEEILKTNPLTVLDIGIGFGKWGFLCREYLESWKDRVFPNQWQVRIEGIEIFKDYVDYLPWNNKIYDKIYLGDAYEMIDKVGDYDLIIAGDIIEHLPKEKGKELLLKGIKKSKCFILSIPLGQEWLNNVVVADNQNERHQAYWEIGDIVYISQSLSGYTLNVQEWKNAKGIGCIAVWRKK